MKKIDQNFIVQVLDGNNNAIRDAQVILKSGKDEFRLECNNEAGFYTYEKVIPRGEYLVTVSRKPFEEDSRKVVVKEGDQSSQSGRGDQSGKGSQNGQRGKGEQWGQAIPGSHGVRSWPSEQRELFILRKQGVPYYYRGKVKVPYEPDEERLALVIPEQPEPPRRVRERRSLQAAELHFWRQGFYRRVQRADAQAGDRYRQHHRVPDKVLQGRGEILSFGGRACPPETAV